MAAGSTGLWQWGQMKRVGMMRSSLTVIIYSHSKISRPFCWPPGDAGEWQAKTRKAIKAFPGLACCGLLP